ncbi:xaa-Pro dipeptidase [Schleiferilactobacillus perolens DSM 12744]|uniref:Xaa-Pro dipeptidase n=2 Tax=Schleiferilactobacillus perolens TaxID=100468 RepID=A0A0R1MY11_9LACO|nr:xaa-Pro dipeptidase [Schleiferilactobacillus perolens DSM 12744]
MQMARVQQFLDKLKEKHIEQFVMLNPKNITYVTDFTGDAAALLATPTKLTLITDGRFTEQAKREMPKEVAIYRWQKGLLTDTIKLINESGIDSVVFEADQLTYEQGRKFVDGISADVIPMTGLVEQMRWVKEPGELDNIKKAVRVADETFLYILGEIHAGMSEMEVSAKMEYFMKTHGGEGTSFDTIVASGIRSTFAHGEASHKIIEAGDILTIDFGALVNGYPSDMTRTIAIGNVDPKLEKAYYQVLAAEQAGIDAITAGMTSRELDGIIRDVFKKDGVEQYFIHGAGHNIGLDIHEGPYITSRPGEGDIVFKANMLETIEPGLYFPGLGGIRIEDDVLITPGKSEVLTTAPRRDLIKIPA